jgi:hypothetical protein
MLIKSCAIRDETGGKNEITPFFQLLDLAFSKTMIPQSMNSSKWKPVLFQHNAIPSGSDDKLFPLALRINTNKIHSNHLNASRIV